MIKEYNIVLSGVGGMGVIKLGKIIGEAASLSGYNVKGTELHGLAQRGGSIYCTVRFGSLVYSPLVPENKADLVVSLELIESLRQEIRPFIKLDKTTKFLVDAYKDIPQTVTKGKETYPSLDEVIEAISNISNEVLIIPATEIASKLGDAIMANIVMLGVMTKYLPLTKDCIEEAIKADIPKNLIEINMQAFEKGLNFKF